MHCLLLISVALWSLVSGIPERDLELMKEVESLTDITYKYIMQETLEFNTYITKLAIECKALEEYPYLVLRWQESLDDVSRVSKKRDPTEEEIQKLVNQVNSPRLDDRQIDSFIRRLVSCTNGTYLERYNTNILRYVLFLDAYEQQAVPNIKKVSNATKEMDYNMYEAFLAFIDAETRNRESAFKNFHKKVMRYDDRVILSEVRALEVQMHQPYMQLLLNTTIYTAEALVKCNAVDSYKMDFVKDNILINVKTENQNLTDDEILNLSNTINLDVIPMDPVKRASIFQSLILCTNGTYAHMKRNTNQKRFEFIKAFKTEINSKMQQVSEATRHMNAKLFKNYEDFQAATDENGEEMYFYLFIKELRSF